MEHEATNQVAQQQNQPVQESLSQLDQSMRSQAQTPPPVAFGQPIELRLDPNARILGNAQSLVVERYRRLRTKLVQQGVGNEIRTVMIASALPGEGKTLTTVNLALSFAMLPGFRVLIVDGDLRRRSLAHRMGAPDSPGLGDLIEGTARLEEVVRTSGQLPVSFLFAGNSAAQPAELIQPTRLKGHIDRLAAHFDLILVDSPPLNPITDAQLLAGSCDGVLLVARAYLSKRAAFERAVHDLQGFRILGAVLNGGEEAPEDKQYKSKYGAL